MKLLLDSSGSAALREFAEAMPEALANITAATEQLMAVYQSVADTLGVHEQDFVDMLTHIKTAQEDASEAIDTIPTVLNDTADRIDAYVARHTYEISGETYGAEINGTSEIHAHTTTVRYGSSKTKPIGATPLDYRKDRTAAQTWGHNHFTGWLSGLSGDEKKAIWEYSGNAYEKLNAYKRAGIPIPKDCAEREARISEALSRTVLPETVTTYRAIPESAMRELALFSGDVLEEGRTFFDNAYQSMSLVSNNSFTRDHSNKYILRTVVPAGIHAGYIGDVSMIPEEEELLIDGKNSYYYINKIQTCKRSDLTGISYDTDEVTVIDCILSI